MVSKARDLSVKMQIVEEIKTSLDKCPTIAIVRYNKVNANSMNELREDLEKNNAVIKIYKNTLVSLATKEKYPIFSSDLKLNNAFVFATDDGLASLKVLKNFQEENKDFEILKGVFNFNETNKAELETLATLPDRDGLLSMLLSTLQGKVRSLMWGLKEVADKKSNEVIKN